MGRGGSVERGECEECEEGESVRRGGDSEWRDRFGGVDWIFFSV